MLHEYKFMKKVDTLEKFKAILKNVIFGEILGQYLHLNEF